MKFLLWCILLAPCWPLALLALIAYPLVWLVLSAVPPCWGSPWAARSSLSAPLSFFPLGVLSGPRHA